MGPGETATCTAAYSATQADLDSGELLNTAIVMGRNPDGDPVRSNESSAAVTVRVANSLSVVKSAAPSGPLAFVVRQRITYTSRA